MPLLPTDMRSLTTILAIGCLLSLPALAGGVARTTTAPAAAVPEQTVPNGYSFFTPYFYGYPGYPASNYPAVPAPIQSQNTPINTCDGGGCSYSAVATYGACYTGTNGQALRNVTTWECRRYDGVVAASSFCEPPASPVPCNGQ